MSMRTARMQRGELGSEHGKPNSCSWLATALLGCTAVTDAGDYEVDPAVAARDLDFSFEAMPHAVQALDVAVVNADKQMQARRASC